jgi:hypothetical protein
MKRFLSLFALAWLFTAGPNVRADAISPTGVTWSYNFTPSATSIFADGNPNAGVTFTNEPTKNAIGNSDVVATNLRVFSSSPASAPDHFINNGAYTLTLVISTVQNGQSLSGQAVFHDKLGGSFSVDNSNVTSTIGPKNAQVQTIILGNDVFTVSMNAYSPPGPQAATNAGSISAHVDVAPTLSVATVPEPSTMLLSCLGLSFLGGAAWRKRRQVVA